MTIPQDLKGVAGTEKVTILVGPSKVPFRVHKNIICQASDFFDAAFNCDFLESKHGLIIMPEDDSHVFSKFVTWLYTSELPIGSGTSCQRLLYDIYILAEKLCMDDLGNRTMDRIRRNQNSIFDGGVAQPERHLDHVKHIFDNTAERSPLRWYISFMMGFEFGFENKYTHQREDLAIKD